MPEGPPIPAAAFDDNSSEATRKRELETKLTEQGLGKEERQELDALEAKVSGQDPISPDENKWLEQYQKDQPGPNFNPSPEDQNKFMSLSRRRKQAGVSGPTKEPGKDQIAA